MSAPIHSERLKENGEAYSFNVYNDAEGARVVIYSAEGEALSCESIAVEEPSAMIEKAKDLCENFIIHREDLMNYRGVAC